MKLSIITINFNNIDGLKRTVESVINQTWMDFEYILVDGGSTDGSADYISQMANHFTYWVSEPDKGIYSAMNKGINRAQGEYFLFLNSGDFFCNNTVLEKVFIIDFKEDLVACDIELVYDEYKEKHSFPDNINVEYFINGTIGHPTTFIKSDLFNRFGVYDEDLKIVSDWKFFLTVVLDVRTTYSKIDILLTTYMMDGVSYVNKAQCILERISVLKKEFPYLYRLHELEKRIIKMGKSRRLRFLMKFGFLKKNFLDK